MRQVYEERAANPGEARKVNELEEELKKTKQYYIKRIRELEERYKYGGAPPSKAHEEKQVAFAARDEAQAASVAMQDKLSALEQTNQQLVHKIKTLMRERNGLQAQLDQSVNDSRVMNADLSDVKDS